ncbi:MAG: LysE family translocator [Rhodocyclaceae bacterium]|nr:LysE family translocator [Rhodocyclaceae bacterium]
MSPAFLLACLLLAVAPGPAVAFIVTRAMTQGRRAGLAAAAGIALGNFANALAASFGLAALLEVAPAAFALFKYAGAAYLIYLGAAQLLRPARGTARNLPAGSARALRDGLLVALLNPKTTLFFAAFLPQFMLPERSVAAQSVTLGAVFVAIAAVTDCAYALAAGTARARLAQDARAVRAGRYLSAIVLLGLGLFAALA